MSLAKLSLACLSLICLTSQVSAKRHWGVGCPTVTTNIAVKDYNVTKMMGLWYEYLITEDLMEGRTYDCSTWLMMQDRSNDTYFTVIQNQLDSQTKETKLQTFEMLCESLDKQEGNEVSCVYQPVEPKTTLEEYTIHKERNFQIIYTDYFSLMIASVCQSYGAFYFQDYIVMTRDKEVSLYHRKMIRDLVKEKGLGASDFKKGQAYYCWGEDYFMI